MHTLKVLLAEALDNLLVAASLMFLVIAFLAAIAEPMAALVPLALCVIFYLVARYKDSDGVAM